jgi:hypothetical protein
MKMRLQLLLAAILVTPVLAAPPSPEDIEIKGAKAEGRWFAWTITNRSEHAVNYFEAPQYGTYTIVPPDGWAFPDRAEMSKTGRVVCRAEDERDALRIGRTGEFRAEVKEDYVVRPKTVIVGFVDGTRLEIGKVDCPSREPVLQRYMPAIGLALIAVVFVAVQALRKKKPGDAGSAAAEQE